MQTGGGGCLPPNPGASKNRSHMDLVHHACRQSICKWGGYVSPNPRAFLSCARRLQVSSCQQKQNPHGPAFRTRDKDFVFANADHEQKLFQALKDLSKTHALFANGGATSPEARWTLSEPVTCVCKWGGGLRPSTPPLSFYAVQACFQKHRTINKTCFTSIIVIELFKPIMLAVHLQTGGATSAPTPALL